MIVEADARILSQEWWVSVVIVGLGVHLAASYLKPRLDRIGGWMSRSWAQRNEKRAQERDARIEEIRLNDNARWKASHKELRRLIVSVLCIVLSLVFSTILSTLALLKALKVNPLGHFVQGYVIDRFMRGYAIALFIVWSTMAFLAMDAMLDVVKLRSELRDAEKLDEEQKKLPH